MSIPSQRRQPIGSRLGISLIEVIACMAILAVMIVPIAGVIRASSQSIAQANGAAIEVKVRSGLRWLRETIRNGDVLTVTSSQLSLRTNTGQNATVRLRSNQLVMVEGRNEIVLLDNVRDVQFQPLVQSNPPRSLIGVSINVEVRDPQSGNVVNLAATVALPPQI